MKYPARNIKAKIIERDTNPASYFIRMIGKDEKKTYCCINYIYENLTDAQCAAYAIEKGRYLNGIGIEERDFKGFYGCEYCEDALDKFAEPAYLTDAHAAICPHKECPYAKEIEQYDDGFPEFF